MLISDFVDKYAGSAWFRSIQTLDHSFVNEASCARKMQSAFWVNYSVEIAYAPNIGYYAFDQNLRRFHGLQLASKKEVALFTLFLVRYCFPPQTTVKLYVEFLDKFTLEYPEMSAEVKKFKEEVIAKSKTS